MAEGNNEENSPDNFRNASSEQNSREGECEENSVSDLVSNIDQSLDRNTPTSSSCAGGVCDIPKKEENPFSFKHFLRSDSSNLYNSQGARPKVYCDGRPVSSISEMELRGNTEHKTRIMPEFSSALPDFVQDHLVIEQCYLGNDSPSQSLSVDLNNLPDFAPDRSSSNRWNESPSHNSNEHRRSNNPPPDIPLDLPIRPQAEFPLDLPAGNSRSCPSSAEVGVSKSLPDFLADGAVRSQSNEGTALAQSPDREVDRLRQELEMCRMELSEQVRKSKRLEAFLNIAHEKEQEYTKNLAKALEQVEETLDRSNRRSESASKTISKLQQEIKSLQQEVMQLQRENRNLRGEDGASGGPSSGSSNITSNEMQSFRFAQELRVAASSAEHSLRQLLTGVDNLRFMANTLENMHRGEDKSDPFLSDLDEDTGPAL